MFLMCLVCVVPIASVHHCSCLWLAIWCSVLGVLGVAIPTHSQFCACVINTLCHQGLSRIGFKVKMATANVVSDYKLVEESLERKYDCPVCLQILCDPCKSLCCGNNFCHGCVRKLQNAGNPCPLCRNSRFRIERNHDLSPEVYHLEVYCANKSKGCDWVGYLGEIDVHLNQNPVSRYQTKGCSFVHVECLHCSQNFQRDQICDHFSTCPRRPYQCEYCQGYDSFYEDVLHNHWPVCDFYPVLCQNGCTENIPRQNIHDHVANHCSMTVVECEFKLFGCTAKLTCKDMSSHMKNSVAAHESLVKITKLFCQIKENNREIRELEAKLYEKQKHFTREQKDLFEKRISSATNQIVSTGQQQLYSVTESLRKRNDQLAKEQRKAQNKRIREAIDKYFEEKVRHQIEGHLDSVTESLRKRNDQLAKEQRKAQNKQIHEAIDKYFEEKVRHQIEGPLDSKYAAQLNELRAENEKLRKDQLDVKMTGAAIIYGALFYWLGWKTWLEIAVFLLILCCPCLCIFACFQACRK